LETYGFSVWIVVWSLTKSCSGIGFGD